MLKSLVNTEIFSKLKQDIVKPSHAYLFYGEDGVLNIEFAKVFIASIFCGKPLCFQCEACRRTEMGKNPDLLLIDKSPLQVADIEGLIDSVQLKTMIYNYKVVFITNAEGINEIAQNKLLKTLEEPNPQVIFVLACTNIEKLLPTIRSRLNKHYLPSINLEVVANDLKSNGINIDRFLHCDITLTEALKYSNHQDNNVLNMVQQSIYGIKSSADIPNVLNELKIKPEQRKEFLKLLLNATNCALSGQQGMFDDKFIQYMQSAYNVKVLIKMQKLIDKSIRMVEANVNFNYVADQLFYTILKEKYLCK